MDWDLFISHASEDKDDVVRPLVELLKDRGLRVWYDEDRLKVGDSIRQSIDRGLLHSRFGVIIVSPDFIRKDWPQRELNALFSLEDGMAKKVLPIWHRVDRPAVQEYSPMLVDRYALSTAQGLGTVAEELVRAIRTGCETLSTSDASSDVRRHAVVQEGSLVATLVYDGVMTPLGVPCEWQAELLIPPPLEQIPLVSPSSNTVTMPDGTSFALPTMDLFGANAHVNKDFLREVALYEQACRLFRPISVAVENTFSATAHDVLLELMVPKNRAWLIRYESNMPPPPKRERNPLDRAMSAVLFARNSGDLEVEERSSDTVVRFTVDTLQPGRRVISESIMMALLESGEFSLEGHTYSSVLPRPATVHLGVRAEITKTVWTVQDVEIHARSIDTD